MNSKEHMTFDMKQAVKRVLGLYIRAPREIELRDFPTQDVIQDDEVRIRLIYGGICGSDLSVYKGTIRHATYPIRPGHELLGQVIETGKHSGFKVGQKVVVTPNTFCSRCSYCLKGKRNICQHKKSLGVNTDGVFSEELIVPAKYVLAVPEEMPDEKAVLIEPFAVVVHALNKVHLNEETSVAVIGCGTEGLLAVMLAHYLGAQVTAVDINPVKLEQARRMGATQCVTPHELSNQRFEVVIEAAGVSNAVEQGFELVKPGGTMVIIGFAHKATMPVLHVVRQEITIHGSIIYNFPHDFTTSMNYLCQDEVNAEGIISKVYHYTEYQQAYDDALSGGFGKIILSFKNEVLRRNDHGSNGS